MEAPVAVAAPSLRYRGARAARLRRLRDLDAFGRVQAACLEPSPIGGTLTLIALLVAIALFASELRYYADPKLAFRFVADVDMDAKLKIELDVTVAMPCARIGADVLDSTNQNVFAFGDIREDDDWFELGPEQRAHFDAVQFVNSHLREEYHAVSELLWRSGDAAAYGDPPERDVEPDRPHDACRIRASLVLNKVAGNFHVTMGKSLHLPRGHVHLNLLFGDESYNFSHRINRLSFGDSAPGVVYPLEGEEKITDKSTMLYQYFIDVVPTSVDTLFSKLDTYQYSAKELARPIDHGKGSHGTPGIFFKYDIAALKLRVSQERDNPIQFTVRLFSVVCGIYVSTGYLNSIVQYVNRAFSKKPRHSERVENLQFS